VKAEHPLQTLFPAGRLGKGSTGFVPLIDDGHWRKICLPRAAIR